MSLKHHSALLMYNYDLVELEKKGTCCEHECFPRGTKGRVDIYSVNLWPDMSLQKYGKVEIETIKYRKQADRPYIQIGGIVFWGQKDYSSGTDDWCFKVKPLFH